MRLTLRTLLAYLDHTLDPQDEAELGEKVRHSTIATELVARIRQSLTSPRGDSPSPDALSPNDDANAIGEYLDNTLAPELTAEVERQCLESESHLSEVAACHQILTIVLAEPATIPPSLRRRIYDVRPSPAEERGIDGVVVVSGHTGGDVRPVGPADSGVANATTRIGDEPDLNATLAAATKTIRRGRGNDRRISADGPAMSGDRSRAQLEAIGPLLSGGRPSRVVPYLLALGLAAAFLFVLMQAFKPLTNGNFRKIADRDEPGVSQDAEASLPPRASVVAAGPRDEKGGAGQANGSGQSPTGPDGAADDADAAAETDAVTERPTPEISDAAAESSDAADDAGPSPIEESPVPAEDGPGPAEDGAGASDAAVASGDGPPSMNPADLLDATEQALNDSALATDGTGAAAGIVGGVEGNPGLLLSQDPRTGQWKRVPSDAPIAAGDVLLCGPLYRSRLMLDGGLELTLIGPTALRIDRMQPSRTGGNPRLFLTMDFGRIIAMATGGPADVSIASPAASGRLELAAAGATAAVSVDFLRPPGSDPLDPASSRSLMRIRSIQDEIVWGHSGQSAGNAPDAVTLQTGQRQVLIVGEMPFTELTSPVPAWIDPTDGSPASVEASARSGLLEFLNSDEPLEKQLRRAVGFRREEVGALAARTLLNLGMPDAYFGPGGVLNRPGQRVHWPELVESLRSFVDRGPASATRVAAAVGELEGEAAGKLWFILAGFSPTQLEKGDAELLVSFLDDPVMSVRVLATETLRQITGTSLTYRPDYETPVRRATGLKKWQTKLRLDQIRWSDPTAAEGRPTFDAPPAVVEETTPQSETSNPQSAPVGTDGETAQ